MANKNIYEVFQEYDAVETKQERIDVLRRNDTWALRNVLMGAFSKNITFTIKDIPEYKKIPVPPGMSYSHMTDALSRIYLFVEGNERRPAGLTEKRERELFIQLVESLEEKEAEIIVGMIKKDLKVPHLNVSIIEEAFPGLLG